MSKQLEAPTLLMPMATAMWLIDNTTLTFDQIGQFTGMHAIQVEAIADGEVGRGIVGRDPVKNGETTAEELEKAAKDSSYVMKYSRSALPSVKVRAKGPKYTPVSKRGDKPAAIAWILKHHPEVSDAQITKLVGTTKPTIQSIRDRSHPDSANIRPRAPMELGLCSYAELEKASEKGLKAQGKDPAAVKAERLAAQAQEAEAMQQAEDENAASNKLFGGFDFSNFMSGSNSGSNGNN